MFIFFLLAALSCEQLPTLAQERERTAGKPVEIAFFFSHLCCRKA